MRDRCVPIVRSKCKPLWCLAFLTSYAVFPAAWRSWRAESMVKKSVWCRRQWTNSSSFILVAMLKQAPGMRLLQVKQIQFHEFLATFTAISYHQSCFINFPFAGEFWKLRHCTTDLGDEVRVLSRSRCQTILAHRGIVWDRMAIKWRDLTNLTWEGSKLWWRAWPQKADFSAFSYTAVGWKWFPFHP